MIEMQLRGVMQKDYLEAGEQQLKLNYKFTR